MLMNIIIFILKLINYKTFLSLKGFRHESIIHSYLSNPTVDIKRVQRLSNLVSLVCEL